MNALPIALIDFITAGFLILGTILLLIAALGLIRMPDLFLRMSASTMAATMGTSSLLLAAGIHFGELSIVAQVVATIFFLFLTAPVGAHIIGRTAYRKKRAPLYDGTVRDDLAPIYKDQA